MFLSAGRVGGEAGSFSFTNCASEILRSCIRITNPLVIVYLLIQMHGGNPIGVLCETSTVSVHRTAAAGSEPTKIQNLVILLDAAAVPNVLQHRIYRTVTSGFAYSNFH